ncbi:MAG: hypothetical protein M2R45_01280 [Verrucomicrobia subdivision 3 bacterium]|nr:hypothetical protein [Limisphaerales bacterium]MCS1415146.1 hypothetical protein [Limisphaerales bacterium]
MRRKTASARRFPNPAQIIADEIKQGLIAKAKRMLFGDRSGVSTAQQSGISNHENRVRLGIFVMVHGFLKGFYENPARFSRQFERM